VYPDRADAYYPYTGCRAPNAGMALRTGHSLAISCPEGPGRISVPKSSSTASTLTGMISVDRPAAIAARHRAITWLNEHLASVADDEFADRLRV
jgi:hypothetical protein